MNINIIADIATLVSCLVLCFLCNAAYIRTSARYTLFKWMLGCNAVAAAVNIGYAMALQNIDTGTLGLLYVLYAFHTLFSYTVLFLYKLYFLKLFDIKYREHKAAYWEPIISYAVLTIFMVIAPWCDCDHFIWQNGVLQLTYAHGLASVAYLLFFAYMVYLLWRWRSALMPRIHICLTLTLALTGALLLIQFAMGTMQYTSICLMIPMFVLYALAHHSTYNLETGTLDGDTLTNYLESLQSSGKHFVILNLVVQQYGDDVIGHRPIDDDFLDKYMHEFYNAYIFRLSAMHNVLIIGCKNKQQISDMHGLINDFETAYNPQGFNYKLIQIDSTLKVASAEQYMKLADYVDDKAQPNTLYVCEQKDYEDFLQAAYILSELEDIARCDNLDDERVLAYCQPVFNRDANIFDSAEALMRLKLPACDIVYPDVVIPLAEQSGYIHTLSRIILNKTCKTVRNLLDKGYIINRISVNFAIAEFRSESFCADIHEIIASHGIPFDKIAIELTESQNNYDFQMLSTRMQCLKKLNIKFYLDDFGTGYSNFDRILSLPIDIIKFDKSLLSMAYKGEDSQYIVQKFAHIFAKLGYPVLLEGVETEDDENFSVNLCASYLQGYKYSKPIPIEELYTFLSKETEKQGA